MYIATCKYIYGEIETSEYEVLNDAVRYCQSCYEQSDIIDVTVTREDPTDVYYKKKKVLTSEMLEESLDDYTSNLTNALVDSSDLISWAADCLSRLYAINEQLGRHNVDPRVHIAVTKRLNDIKSNLKKITDKWET